MKKLNLLIPSTLAVLAFLFPQNTWGAEQLNFLQGRENELQGKERAQERMQQSVELKQQKIREEAEQTFNNLSLGKAHLMGIGYEKNIQKGFELFKPYMKEQDIKNIGKINSVNGELFLYNQIGRLLFEKSKDNQLSNFSNQLLQDCIDFNLKVTEGDNVGYAQNAYFNLAGMAEDKGDAERAKEYYKSVINYHTKVTEFYSDWEEGKKNAQNYTRNSYSRLADIAEKQEDTNQQILYLTQLIDFAVDDKIRLNALIDLGFLKKDKSPIEAVGCWNGALFLITKLGNNEKQVQYLNYNIGVLLHNGTTPENSKKYFNIAANLQSINELRLGAYLHLASFKDADFINYLQNVLPLTNGSFRAYILWELFCYDVIGDDLRWVPYLEECAFLGYKPAIDLLHTLKCSKEEVNDQEDTIQEILNYKDIDIQEYSPIQKIEYKKVNGQKIQVIQEQTKGILASIQNQKEILQTITKDEFPSSHINFLYQLKNDRKNIKEHDALKLLGTMPKVEVTHGNNKYTVSIRNQRLKDILRFGHTIGSHFYHPRVKSRNKECLDPNFAKDLLELLNHVYNY